MPKRIISLSVAAYVVLLSFVQAQERHIYWTNAKGKILRGDENGTAYKEIISARLPSVIAIASDGLYWADAANFAIQRSSLDGAASEVVISGTGRIAQMVVDPKSKKLYWLEQDSGKIWGANLDGTGVVTLQEGLLSPSALAIDSLAGKLYWASTVNETTQMIQRANLDGTQSEDVLAAPSIVLSLVVDATHGMIYWISNGTREIRRANFDGQNMETIIAEVTPSSLALDPQHGKIYLAGFQKIVRMNLDGTETEELVTGIALSASSLCLHLTEGKMYWVDEWTARIQRANLEGNEVDDVLVGFVPPRGLALDVENEKVYWTGFGEILRASFEGSKVEYVVNVACGIGELYDIAIDPEEDKMYWIRDSDCGGGSQVHRANLDGSKVENLSGGGIIHHLALDLEARKLYWSDAGGRLQSRGIYRANLDGSEAEALINNLNAPGGIAIDGQNRKVYWTEYPHSVYRASLDGTNIESLMTGLSVPGEIALAVQNGKMYWTEHGAGKIRRANLDGTGIEDLFTGLEAPHRIALTFEGPGLKVEEAHIDMPAHFELLQNYPNPFNASTRIEFELPRAHVVSLEVFTVHGEVVAVLIDRQKLAAGRHRIILEAESLPSGFYVYRLQTGGDFVLMRKLVLLK